MKTIQILGTGCAKCTQLAERVEAATRDLKIDCTIEKVTDMASIVKFGVMTTPALVVDGQVKVAGRIPDVAQIMQMIG